MTHITCRLTVKNRDQLRNPTLGSRVWATCTFTCIVNKVKNQSAAWVEGWANVWTEYMTQQWRVVFVGACLLEPAVSEPLVPATGPCPTAGSLLVAETQLDVSPFDR